MIITSLTGGLGNQLFQYAAGRSLAHYHQTELVLDLEWFNSRPDTNTPRHFELGNYNIAARFLSPAENRSLRFYRGRILSRISFLPRKWRLFTEKSFCFDPDFFKLPNDVYLRGYWQSAQYFEVIRNILLKEFAPIDPPGSKNEALLREMNEGNSVSLHIRRGDYLSNPVAAEYHGICPLDYYERAIGRIEESFDNPHFFVFSDDLDWARANLNINHPVKFIGHNSGAQAFQDIRLIAACKHQIIANSSFSWWGAWLNQNPKKMVIAPKQWFLAKKDTSTLIPNDWIRI